MKTLIVVRQLAGGGAEASMARLQEEFHRRGIEIHIAAINSKMAPDTPGDSQIILSTSTSRVTQIIQAFSSLRKLHQREGFQKVILNCELAEFLGVLALPRRTKIFVVEHTSRPWIGRRLVGFVVRLLLALRGARWITVVSDGLRIWPFNQVAIHIPNPIEVRKFVEGSSSGILQKEIVYVGRLAPSKRPDLVVKVAADLGLPLHVFGEGEMFERLIEQAKSHEVHFYGFVPDVWSKISPSWILIFPSLYEGDGMVVLEAALHGNPVLLSDIEDLRRLGLPDRCYFANYVALRDKLLSLLQNESDLEFRISSEYLSRIKKARSLEVVGDQWLAALGS